MPPTSLPRISISIDLFGFELNAWLLLWIPLKQTFDRCNPRWHPSATFRRQALALSTGLVPALSRPACLPCCSFFLRRRSQSQAPSWNVTDDQARNNRKRSRSFRSPPSEGSDLPGVGRIKRQPVAFRKGANSPPVQSSRCGRLYVFTGCGTVISRSMSFPNSMCLTQYRSRGRRPALLQR